MHALSLHFLWPDNIAKKFLGMERDMWRTIESNEGFVTRKGTPRERRPKQLIPVRESDGRFRAVSACQEARELASATRYELI